MFDEGEDSSFVSSRSVSPEDVISSDKESVCFSEVCFLDTDYVSLVVSQEGL